MKISKIRFLESFVIATFPIAVVVGCTATGEHQPTVVSMEQENIIGQQTSEYPQELNIFAVIERNDNIESNIEDQTQSEKGLAMGTPQDSVINLNTDTMETTQPQADKESAQNEGDLIQVHLRIPGYIKIVQPEKLIFNFEASKYNIVENDYEHLQKHAAYLQENPHLTLNVNGFSDNRGSAKLNYELSKKRAQQIADILTIYGAPESQIKVNGYGESFPANDENNWDENRRVELQYIEASNPDGLIVSAF